MGLDGDFAEVARFGTTRFDLVHRLNRRTETAWVRLASEVDEDVLAAIQFQKLLTQCSDGSHGFDWLIALIRFKGDVAQVTAFETMSFNLLDALNRNARTVGARLACEIDKDPLTGIESGGVLQKNPNGSPSTMVTSIS